MTTHDHAHEHGHHHHHHHAATGNTLVAALSITFIFAFAELIGGWVSGSLALLGDAGHMFSDAAALGLAAFAAWIARRPPSSRHSYGMVRAEVLAALVNGLFMLAIVAGIINEAIDRLQKPTEVDGMLVIWIAFAGLIVNILVAYMLMRGEQSLNVRGALLHVMGDLLGSVAALISGVVIVNFGWNIIDPLLSIFICLLILISTFHLLREVTNVIMEGVPLHIDFEQVGKRLAGQAGVFSVHDLHIWTLASGKVALSAHIVVRDFESWSEVLGRLQSFLHDEFEIDHVTLQPETSVVEIPVSKIQKQRLQPQ
ncbi:MAG: cation diffusion facilitator family transporter [Gammaproteobacteria bacterium]|nr:cation diffusion facilitator family transporter [Gammaproteobacteria bacterium]